MFDLLSKLRECGESLPESAKVAPVDVPNVLAALIHYAETGSYDPLPPGGEGAPMAAAPDQSARVAELEAQLAAANEKAAAAASDTEPDAGSEASAASTSEPVGSGQAVLTGGAVGGASASGALPLPAEPSGSTPTAG